MRSGHALNAHPAHCVRWFPDCTPFRKYWNNIADSQVFFLKRLFSTLHKWWRAVLPVASLFACTLSSRLHTAMRIYTRHCCVFGIQNPACAPVSRSAPTSVCVNSRVCTCFDTRKPFGIQALKVASHWAAKVCEASKFWTLWQKLGGRLCHGRHLAMLGDIAWMFGKVFVDYRWWLFGTAFQRLATICHRTVWKKMSDLFPTPGVASKFMGPIQWKDARIFPSIISVCPPLKLGFNNTEMN